MKRIAIATALMIVLFALAAKAQTTPPPPGPEQKKLAVFIGTWTGEGKEEATPFSKGGAVKSTMNCGWFTGGYHLVCDSDDSGPTGKIKAHSLYGYDAEKKQYYTFGIESTGYGGPMSAKVDGSTWTFEGSDTVSGKTYWFRTIVKLTSPTELTYKSEYSEDNKTWKPEAEGKMVKK
jgi:hypothetical protein